MPFTIVRNSHPRLFRPADDPAYSFRPSRDPVRKRILKNILADCEAFASQKPWKRIPERLDSPHPFHQLYITFYSGMHATALIETYAFAWRVTGDQRWLDRARKWLLAAANWEHSDRVEEHFYTANRYMHAFAFGLDMLGGSLKPGQEDAVTESLVRMMNRWWPEVDKSRTSKEGGHHAVVDNAHFGVAAVNLLGKHPDAPKWLEAVVERFRGAIMPNGCGRNGEPRDGANFWPWENLWMLQFADALRNVTGINLLSEFPERLSRPVEWFQYHQVSPELNIGVGKREIWSTTLLRLAQETGHSGLHEMALGDPQLGRIYRFGMGVKNSRSECMIAYGPYAYCAYDPAFESRSQDLPPPSRKFTDASSGKTALLRSGWESSALVACVTEYSGAVANRFSDLEVLLAGRPLFKAVPCEEAQPLSCGNLPCVGGQNEILAVLGGLDSGPAHDHLGVRSVRVEHDYWLLREDPPILLVALRRRPRGIQVAQESAMAFVRLDGKDYLQFPREPFFNPNAGSLRLRFRLTESLQPGQPRILFSSGVGIPGQSGTQVNNFTLGFVDGKTLSFNVQSQRYNHVKVSLPAESVTLAPGQWCEVRAAWGGFNDPNGKPFIELESNTLRERCDDPASFGELGRDTQNLQSRSTPRTFYIRPNTLLAFGAAIQLPATATKCDIERIELTCPDCRPLKLSFPDGLSHETGSGRLSWKLHPVGLKSLSSGRAKLAAGRQSVDLLTAWPGDAALAEESVPYAPSGLAGASLKWLSLPSRQPSKRLLVSTESGEDLIWVLAPSQAKVRIERTAAGFHLLTRSGRRFVSVGPSGISVAIR